MRMEVGDGTARSEVTIGWSACRGHGQYRCAKCGRSVPESSTGLVYVLDESRGDKSRRVEPDCFELARDEAWPFSYQGGVSEDNERGPRRSLPLRQAPNLGDRPNGLLKAAQVAMLRSAGRFPPDASEDEIQFGLEMARRIGLDPWLGQVKFLRFDSAEKIHAFVGIDGMRSVAERSGRYDGREVEVEFAKGTSGQAKPIRAICRVFRKDWSRPLVEEVRFEEAVRRRKDGRIAKPWLEMPATMLRKVAEERALRAAFPIQLSGVYGDEEALPGGVPGTPAIQTPVVSPDLTSNPVSHRLKPTRVRPGVVLRGSARREP